MNMACSGNALECTVHGSPWWTSATEPLATVCVNVRLAGEDHRHDARGRRVLRGQAGGLACVCEDVAPTSVAPWLVPPVAGQELLDG